MSEGNEYFILYDGRARDPKKRDDAMVFDCAETEELARILGRDVWAENDVIWYEFEITHNGTRQVLTNPKPRYDLPPMNT